MSGWDAALQLLLSEGTIEGFALLDHNSGSCLSTCGELRELWGDGLQPSPAAQQLRSMFHSGEARGRL